MMKYKNYLAEVEVDESVGLLHGRVVNSGPYPIATFEAENVAGLRKEFELSVDEYLLSCEEGGAQPNVQLARERFARLHPSSASSCGRFHRGGKPQLVDRAGTKRVHQRVNRQKQ